MSHSLRMLPEDKTLISRFYTILFHSVSIEICYLRLTGPPFVIFHICNSSRARRAPVEVYTSLKRDDVIL